MAKWARCIRGGYVKKGRNGKTYRIQPTGDGSGRVRWGLCGDDGELHAWVTAKSAAAAKRAAKDLF